MAIGCQNQDWSFPDLGYTTTYFPHQTPVRTIIQGEADGYDVTSDHKGQFTIAVCMGGVYENKVRRVVGFEMAPDLVGDIREKDSLEVLEVLPEAYYTLSNNEEFVIPVGKEDGRITVQLQDAFFDDPNAYKTHYVIPMRITSTTCDSILVGQASSTFETPDPRFDDGWSVTPKNYTLFGIKFNNKYHGKYLHRGKMTLRDIDNDTLVGSIVYDAEYIEQLEQVMATTMGRYSVGIPLKLRVVENTVNNPLLYPGAQEASDIYLKLTLDPETETGTITGAYNAQGTVKWLSKETSGESWGNKKRSALVISYTAEAPDSYLKYQANDTLVYMSNMVASTFFSPELIE